MRNALRARSRLTRLRASGMSRFLPGQPSLLSRWAEPTRHCRGRQSRPSTAGPFPAVVRSVGAHQGTNGVSVLSEPLRPSRLLSGRRFVVVGGTGFLGKVWVSMLLTRFPDVEHLYLMVRPKDGQNADERFWSQIV